MFENTIKNITTGRQEMFDSGLKMYKEMCPNDNPNNCAQAREAWFVMGNLQTMYQEFEHSICGLTLTALAENIKQYNKFEQQYDMYYEALSPYLRGDEESRLKALMQVNYVTVNNEDMPLKVAAKNLSQIKENLANTKEWIAKIEQSLANKKYIMYQCHKQLKEIYDRFKADQAAQQKKEEKKPQQKRITVFIDNSWPMSPRQIQQAIDTLTAFVKVQGEGDGPIEKGIEGLKALKKGVEQDIMDNTKCVQDGMYFKLKVVE
jgi:hypothetical protein